MCGFITWLKSPATVISGWILIGSYDDEINKVFVEWLHDKFGVTYWFL